MDTSTNKMIMNLSERSRNYLACIQFKIQISPGSSKSRKFELVDASRIQTDKLYISPEKNPSTLLVARIQNVRPLTSKH